MNEKNRILVSHTAFIVEYFISNFVRYCQVQLRMVRNIYFVLLTCEFLQRQEKQERTTKNKMTNGRKCATLICLKNFEPAGTVFWRDTVFSGLDDSLVSSSYYECKALGCGAIKTKRHEKSYLTHHN